MHAEFVFKDIFQQQVSSDDLTFKVMFKMLLEADNSQIPVKLLGSGGKLLNISQCERVTLGHSQI